MIRTPRSDSGATMSSKRSKRHSVDPLQRLLTTGTRDLPHLTPIASTLDYGPLDLDQGLWSPPHEVRSRLSDVEDLRTFSPAGDAQTVTVGGRPTRLTTSPGYHHSFSPPVQIGYEHPRVVATCVRRHQRREVLFASGKGGGKHKKPRFNSRSTTRC